MATLPCVLICDDDSVFHLTVQLAFKGECQFSSAFHGEEALSWLRKKSFALVLLDIQMRTPSEGLNYIQKIKEIDPDISIIITSGIKDFKTVKDALKLGADDYILKGTENDELNHAITRTILGSLENKKLVRCNETQNAEVLRLHMSSQKTHSLLGISPAMEQLRHQIEKVRESTANVLITGETGTGKEVVARLLRKVQAGCLSRPFLEPFVAIDSSTIQSSMAESMLFGHEKGAFTGADRTQKGIFEEASGGAVYFDEIANMPLEIQNKLLRVLEEKEIRRLGSQRLISLEFRVICASNQNLDEWVEQGRFKADLLQRLQVIPLTLPPLRDRKEDIPILIHHFLKIHNKTPNKISNKIPNKFQRCLVFEDSTLEVLNEYSWPGNVRELSNLVLYLLSMTENDQVSVSDLPPKIRNSKKGASYPLIQKQSEECLVPGNFRHEIFKFERKVLQDALNLSQGRVSRASELLGIDRSHLYSKLKEHGLFTGRRSSPVC